jgi:alkyl sulfatase BDS1-like metallo-beta-lactamase superfamily hydrolase
MSCVMPTESYDRGKYRCMAEVVNHVVFADAENVVAKNLLADAQLGYQAESGRMAQFLSGRSSRATAWRDKTRDAQHRESGHYPGDAGRAVFRSSRRAPEWR